MKSSKRSKRFPVLSVIIAAALIAAAVLFLERVEFPEDSAARKSLPAERPGKAVKQKTPADGNKGLEIAVIIDDIGFDLGAVEELAKIKAPLGFAILPNAPYAAEAAEILHAAGKEILLHLPMEPRSYPEESPGAGALLVHMDAGEIRMRIAAGLAAVPHVSGVNNHMGSLFMEDEARLFVVMDELGKRGLFFVDSMTTPGSRGREAASRAGVRFAARNVFIDHEPGYAAALEKLTSPPRQGRKNGAPLVMIGHPHPETVRALKKALPILREEGVRLIPVSAALKTPGG